MGFKIGRKTNFTKHIQQKCEICNKICKSTQGFSYHIKKIHQFKLWEYKLKFEYNNIPPLCQCGCGKNSPINYHETDFSQFVQGHNPTGGWHHTDEAKFKSGSSFRGKHLSEDHRNKISSSTVKNYQIGGGSWKRGEFYSKKNNKINIYRSSWELQFMEELEADDNVESYRYEEFCINYIFEGTKRRYLPDFVVKYKDGSHKIIEIGQKKQKAAGMDLAKITATEEFCKKLKWKFELITDVHFGR